MFEDVKWKTDKNLPQVPFISSLVESRLLISAVICNDMKLLTNLKVIIYWKNILINGLKLSTKPIKRYLNDFFFIFPIQDDHSKVHSLTVPRSLSNQMTALHYAIQTENLKAIGILSKTDNINRVAAPKTYLKTVGK